MLRRSQFRPSAREYGRGLVVLLSVTWALTPVLNSHGPQTNRRASFLLTPAG